MIEINPIAVVRNSRKLIEDDQWGEVVSTLELLPPLMEDALAGIETFSHVEVIFHFDRVQTWNIETGTRHPRNNANWPRIGILAQRGKNRPNRIGTTICKLISRTGSTLTVQGLDAVDGTPVLDIKPVMKEFLPHEEIRQPNWVDELMKHYWD
ncbi:MAG: tRNA (N6-threonylcarbamoyladenosine(37)-N6)-methyltransferase TrmO [Anaerolinea sp.]|nr:tRNA (N6-threonylcarbamoyladenosine(37)-N6)-methyltransferase TrmO [Anaerolinea sp.]